MKRVWLSWSSGKDSAWTLHVLRQRADLEVVGLLTTVNGAVDRVAMHAVHRSLLQLQADRAGLPLHVVPLPSPCTNEEYERLMSGVISAAAAACVTHMAFGDLFLEDVRAYRERQLAGTGIEPLFPLWGSPADTGMLASEMIAGGVRAIITCVDTEQLDPRFLARDFDERLLRELPAAVDPCGERGEFHTFCHDAPCFERPIDVIRGEVVERGRFHFADLASAPDHADAASLR